jgi:CSLREA domain-containing protein
MFALWIAAVPAGAAIITVEAPADDNNTQDMICTLREAVQSAFEDNPNQSNKGCEPGSGADTIVFDAGKVPSGTVIELPLGSISLSSSVTIQGPATLSKAAGSPIFVLASSYKITIKDIDFLQSSTSGSGGAILINGGDADVTIDNCTFTENQAGSEGGAISAGGGKLTIKNSYFALNTSGQGGGAVKASGIVTIEDSWFEDNVAGFGGGAVFCGSGSLTVTRSYFGLNVASGGPRAIFTGGGGMHTQCSTEILHSHFHANHTFGDSNGGGLYIGASGSANVKQSLFHLNSAGFGSTLGGGGGGIFSQGETLLDRVVIWQNFVKGGYGGAGVLFFGNSTKESTVVNTAVIKNASTEKDSVPISGEGEPCTGRQTCLGAGISVVGKSMVKIIASTLAWNSGREELFVDGDATAELTSTLIDGKLTDQTCGGQLGQILNGELNAGGFNLQWAGLLGDPTCLSIDKGNPGIQILTGGSFPASTPVGPLSFSYPRPSAVGAAAGAGDGASCAILPVDGKDLLDKDRPLKCTVGAVETSN